MPVLRDGADVGQRDWVLTRPRDSPRASFTDADIAELTTLAKTGRDLVAGLANARTEGTSRLVKQVRRAACGFRNRENHRTSAVALHPAHPPFVSEETGSTPLSVVAVL